MCKEWLRYVGKGEYTRRLHGPILINRRATIIGLFDRTRGSYINVDKYYLNSQRR